jgi:hypothetical protein
MEDETPRYRTQPVKEVRCKIAYCSVEADELFKNKFKKCCVLTF